ncbi:hypothetical protein [Butyrivibrio sp. FC2001]|uniref:hypothetical protein n=1 Tax=Butyrivibrio sp. FC2001 TaxID=1280671 RepID=UPI00047E5FE1|nr:hypothetical protein [Butyrivibrio sp. FC2001]
MRSISGFLEAFCDWHFVRFCWLFWWIFAGFLRLAFWRILLIFAADFCSWNFAAFLAVFWMFQGGFQPGGLTCAGLT